MAIHVTIGKNKVPVTAEKDIDLESAVLFRPFQDWRQAWESEEKKHGDAALHLKSIHIQSVDQFSSGKIGFIKFKADAELPESGKSVPGITFMRGGSISVLLVLKTEKSNHPDQLIFTLQPRVPVPAFQFPELPAGMLDGDGQFAGKAAEEIKEETGLEIKEDELIDMTELAYGKEFRGVYPSPDEFLRLFVCEKTLSEKDIKSLEGKLTGLRDHGESITLKIVQLQEAWKQSPDAKLLASLALYDALKREQKL